MPYWDCPRCAAENSLDASSCWRCGYQYFPGYQGGGDRHESDRESADPLHKQSRDMLKEMKEGLADALDKSRASLDRIARGRSGTAGGKRR